MKVEPVVKCEMVWMELGIGLKSASTSSTSEWSDTEQLEIFGVWMSLTCSMQLQESFSRLISSSSAISAEYVGYESDTQVFFKRPLKCTYWNKQRKQIYQWKAVSSQEWMHVNANPLGQLCFQAAAFKISCSSVGFFFLWRFNETNFCTSM